MKSLHPPKVENVCTGQFCDFFPDDYNGDTESIGNEPTFKKHDLDEMIANGTLHTFEKRVKRTLKVKWPSEDEEIIAFEGQPSRGVLFLSQRAQQVLNSFAHRANDNDCTDISVTSESIPDVRNLPDWTPTGETEHPVDVSLTADFGSPIDSKSSTS